MRQSVTVSGGVSGGGIDEVGGAGSERARVRPGELRRTRVGAGPRPVRPAVSPVAVRPSAPPRPPWATAAGEAAAGEPVWQPGPAGTGVRVLERAVVPVRVAGDAGARVRRVLSGVAVVVLSAAVVVALGLLGAVAKQARAGSSGASVSEGSLVPVMVEPGRVLRVPAG